MQLETLFTEALGIMAPWHITSLKFDSVQNRLDITVDFPRGTTFTYTDPKTKETGNYKAYDTVQRTWRHLNFFEHECYLHVRVPRVKPSGGGTVMIFPIWHGCSTGFTLLFESLILRLCTNMPVHQVGKILNVSDYRLWRVLEAYVKKALNAAKNESLTAVGIDETSLKRGHNYISLFVDLAEKKTIFVGEGKDNSTVRSFVNHLETTQGNRGNIKDVSCDMSPAFIKGVRENLPQAQITFDKFHVLKVINEGVDAVRRSESSQNPILKKALKGSRYVFLKNEQNLSAKQKETKETLSKLNLKSMRALHIRENFQEIYKASSFDEFEKLLKQWYYWATHSRLEPIKKAAKTIKKHWQGILQWKHSQITNGILEGLNSIVQAAKRKARGYKFEHLKVIVYLLTGKLNLKQFNQVLPTHF